MRFFRFVGWNWDFFGFSASFLCAVHCLILPFLLSLGLLGGLAWLHRPPVEWSLIGFAVLIAGPAFYRGYRGHRRLLPVGMAGLGILLLAGSRWSHAYEHLLTGAGGILIATAHWFNWRYGRCPVRVVPKVDSNVPDRDPLKKPVSIGNLSALLLLLTLAACSPTTPDQPSRPAQPEVTSADTASDQQQEPEPVEATVLPLDSSAYAWQDGYRVVPWSTLDSMELEWVYEEDLGQERPYPIFNPQVLALNGQPIQVSGYAIPFEETGIETIVILSAYPYSQCFFCGGAGPGSVLDILPKSPLPKLPFDEKTTFRGKLRLNDDDLQYLNYILDDAELVK